MPRKDLIIITLIFLSVCAFYFFRAIGITEPGFPLDDSWIHQVFARNIVTGHGFSFNPDRPIAGATAPLWTLTVGVPGLLLGPIAGGILTGLFFQWLALIGIYRLSTILIVDRNSSLLVAVLSALCWPLVWGALSGMEIGLYSALSFWGLFFYLRSERFDDGRVYIAYLLFTLSFLSRPECGLFLAGIFIRDFFVWSRARPKPVTPWLVRCLIIVIPLLPYVAFNYSTANTLLPLTVSAKLQDKNVVLTLFTGEIKRFVKALVFFPYFYLVDFLRKTFQINPLIVLASVYGMLKLTFEGRTEKSKIVMLALLFVSYTPLMGAVSPMTSPSFQQFRLCANLLPILILFGVAGLFRERGQVPVGRKNLLLILAVALTGLGASSGILYDFGNRLVASVVVQAPSLMNDRDYVLLGNIVRAVGIGTMIAGLTLSTALALSLDRFRRYLSARPLRWALILIALIFSTGTIIHNRDVYANNVRNINERNVAAGLYLGKLANPGDTVAVNDVGAIGYFSNMTILDLKGLISPEIRQDMIIDDSLAFEYMYHHRRVHYLAIAPEWFQYLPGRTDVFRPIAEFVSENNTIVAGDTTVIYEAVWPDPAP